jgi:hypothetical protein
VVEALEEEALEEEALDVGAMVAHQTGTGTGTQLGGSQARQRRETGNSWKMKMKIKMKSLQSLRIQKILPKGSSNRYLVAICTFFIFSALFVHSIDLCKI